MTITGYSGTSLAKKAGFKSPLKLLTINAPREYKSWLGVLPKGVFLITKTSQPVEAAHVFTAERMFLDMTLSRLRSELAQDGFVWVSWPKKALEVPTDITEDTIREIALPLGFVDIRVDLWKNL